MFGPPETSQNTHIYSTIPRDQATQMDVTSGMHSDYTFVIANSLAMLHHICMHILCTVQQALTSVQYTVIPWNFNVVRLRHQAGHF